MKPYTILWWPPAQDDLTKLWVQSDDRQALARAADEIDRLLSIAAPEAGDAGHEGIQRLIIRPLVVQYAIDDGDRKVTILSVRQVF